MKISSYSNRIGGFVSLNTGTIKDSYSDAKVKYRSNAAGFVFENVGNISCSFAQKFTLGKENLGGFCVRNKGTLESCGWLFREGKKNKNSEAYTDKNLALDYKDIKEIHEKLSLGACWQTPEEKDARLELLPLTGEAVISGNVVEIKSKQELFQIASDIANGDDTAAKAHYILTRDINLGGKKWLPIGFSEMSAFRGIFDGNGHKIYNFKINAKGLAFAGFFGYVKGAVVKNLTLDCVVNAAGGSVIGGMCAHNSGGTFTDCRVIAKVYAQMTCGGFCGHNDGLIERCAFIGKVGSGIPIIFFWLPLLAALLLLLLIGLIIFLINMRETPYTPSVIDPNGVPIVDTTPVTPPPEGSHRIGLYCNTEVYINAETGVGIINFDNPRSNTLDLVVRILVSDAELLRTIGTTGRTAEAQAALEAEEDYDAETSYQELYRSGRLQIGYRLEATQLGALADGTVLPIGEYTMLVAVDAYDPETYEKAVVNTQAPIKVYIVDPNAGSENAD